MAGPPSVPDPDDFIVLPDHGPPPQARIKCVSSTQCPFQYLLDIDDLIVKPNGFAIAMPTSDTFTNGPNTYVPNPTGVPWPPSWWPTQTAVSPDFAPGVPTVPPGFVLVNPSAPFVAPLSEGVEPTTTRARVEQPTGPEPHSEPRNRPRR